MILPKGIDPCPIKEAIIEIRFESVLPPDAVFGVVYNELKDIYKTPEPLPIMQLPASVRDQDKNLHFQPYYRIKRDNFLLQIGPQMLSLAVTAYSTWVEFLGEKPDPVTERVE